ncbi:MAG: hypothetical protein M3122_06915 [Actinomycetota bacterium]|nr:hypothetical protein [Actinomycetota bacterium]
MAPHTDIAPVCDSYQNMVQNLRDKGLTEGDYDHLEVRGPLGGVLRDHVDDQPSAARRQRLSDYKGFEDQVQALENQARALESISKYIREALDQRRIDEGESAAHRQGNAS